MLIPKMKHRQGGFTLIELMFTIVVLGVLLGIGIPNLRDFLRNGRMTGYANDLLADVNVARTEAIKRRVVVGVCASADPLASTPACAAPDATSFRGWLVFVDDANPNVIDTTNDGNGSIQAGETILRRHELLASPVTARSDTAFISFAETGFTRAIGSTASATRVVMCDARGNIATTGDRSAARGIQIERTGRARVTRSVTEIASLDGC
jgi:type IV fimbrial biogenesis protein FimT